MKRIIICLFATFSVLLISTPVSAQVNDFVINNFHADYVIDNNAVGGSLETYEKIEVNYKGQNHGILRAIPTKHKTFDTKIDVRGVVRDGVNEPFTTYKENGNLVLKIGDPNKTITGYHEYNIYYYQERVINFSAGLQEFYWDVNGNGWSQEFENISATVTLKNGEFSAATPICYTGYQGYNEQDCNFSVTDKTNVTFATTRPMLAGQGMTIGLDIIGVSFIQPTLKDKILDNKINIIGVFFGIVLSLFSVRYWKKHGKDLKGRGVIIPEYEPPKDLTPAEVGMLFDYKVDGKDMSATLIDLAVRGYVKIHQENKKILFFNNNKFSLELMKDDLKALKPHETALLNGVFGIPKLGQIIEVKNINKSKMAASVSEVNKNVKDALIDKYGLIDKKAHRSQVWMYSIAFGLIFVQGFLSFLPVGFRIGIIIFAVVTLWMGIIMARRTHAGQETYEKIKGLQVYMNTAEKDRLKMMQSVDRPYAEPSKTAELFEKLLPFAVALGVEKSWAKQFDGILTQQPEWISGNATAFSATHLASSLGGVTTTFSKSFETSSGASGGGGGGGGGGGW